MNTFTWFFVYLKFKRNHSSQYSQFTFDGTHRSLKVDLDPSIWILRSWQASTASGGVGWHAKIWTQNKIRPMKGSLKRVFTGAGLVVMNLLQATGKIGISWRVEQPYSSNLLLREASIFRWFFALALPCCQNHCRRSSSVDSIKSSIFYGSHWSPFSTESLIVFFSSPSVFFSIHFAHEDARSQKSKDPSMFFSSSDPSNPLKKMEIKRNEQQKWQRSNGSKQSLTGDGSLGKD